MRQLSNCGLTVVALLMCTSAAAQQTTEVYIPIGESPGISGSKSVNGTITEVEYDNDRMTVATSTGAKTVMITASTRYYIDKTSKKLRNETGNLYDCEKGRRIEAYVDKRGTAVWIKIAGT